MSRWCGWMCRQSDIRARRGRLARDWRPRTGGVLMRSDRWKVAVKKCSGYLLLCLSAGRRWIKVREHVEAVRPPFHLLPKWVWGLESAVYPLHSAWQRNHLKPAAEETAVCHQRQRSNQLFTRRCLHTHTPAANQSPRSPAAPRGIQDVSRRSGLKLSLSLKTSTSCLSPSCFVKQRDYCSLVFFNICSSESHLFTDC